MKKWPPTDIVQLEYVSQALVLRVILLAPSTSIPCGCADKTGSKIAEQQQWQPTTDGMMNHLYD